MPLDFDFRFQNFASVSTGNSSLCLSAGISPSTATIEIAAGVAPQKGIADLMLTSNGRTVITFKDCAITRVIRAEGDGTTYQVVMKDRRWKWERGGGIIKGWYNRRNAKGKVIPETYKNPRELAEILLEKLGEEKFDVSGIPTNIPKEQAPEANWDYIRPAEALGKLCDALGCRVVLGTDDRIRICRTGVGKQLPRELQTGDGGATLERTDIPEKLLFIADRTLFQGYLLLEAVGLDLDNKIKPINDLSYKPSDGWEKHDPANPETGVTFGRDDKEKKKAKKLAQQTVWKWYRIKGQADGTLAVKGFKGEGVVDDIGQYLPLPGTPLFDSTEDDEGNTIFLDPYVEGIFWPADMRGENTKAGTRYEEGFSIKGDTGVVQFSRPTYQVKDTAKGYQPAQVWLFCTYWVSEKKSRQPERWTFEKKLAKTGAGSLPVPVDDVGRQVTYEYTTSDEGPKFSKFTDNLSEVQKAAEYYLAAKQVEIEPTIGEDQTYAGFVNVSPDGAVQQVTWELADGEAHTRASRNTEHNVNVPKYELRRRAQQTDAALAPRLSAVPVTARNNAPPSPLRRIG